MTKLPNLAAALAAVALALPMSANAATFFTSAAAYAAATGGNTTYDFIGVPPAGSFINVSSSYALGPVTFNGNIPFVISGTFFGGLYNNQDFYSDQNSVQGLTTVLTWAGSTAFAMNFGGYATGGGAPVTFTLSDGSSYSTTFPSPGASQFFGFASAAPITSITWSNPNGYSNDVVDFTIGNAVPEPASWALMIAGFGLVGTALRRRTAALAAA